MRSRGGREEVRTANRMRSKTVEGKIGGGLEMMTATEMSRRTVCGGKGGS